MDVQDMGHALPVALTALRSRSGMRRVLLAYGLYNIVEIACWMAIVIWAYQVGGAALAGASAVVQLLPSAVLAPMVASMGDRLRRGVALVVAHGLVAVATLLTLVALMADAPVWVVVAASTTITTSVAVVRPIHYAALPQIAVSADELVSGNAMSSAGEQFAFFAGPLIAGVVIDVWTPSAVMALAFAASVAGTLLCLGLTTTVAEDTGDEGVLRAAFEGLRALRADWGSLALLVIMASSFVIAGALDVLGVAYADLVLGDAGTAAGFVVGAIGVGGLLGAGMATTVAGRRRLTPVIAAAGACAGLVLALVSLTASLGPVVVLVALTGVAEAVFLVCSRTLLQRSTDDSVLARVFAVQESTSLLGLAIGAALAPLLIDRLSAAEAFLPLGLGMAAIVLLGSVLVHRLDARAVFRPREVGLLQGVPFFAVLPAYEVERLAQRARWTDVSAGTEVIRQGEDGESFYVVEVGEFAVTVDGERRNHVMGAGSSYGEIALLHEIPRTATITALTDGRVLEIDRADFLAAVTGSADGQALAREVSARHMTRDAAP